MTRISERRLGQIQAVSGLAFATFLVLHLSTMVLATAGQETFDGVLRVFRVYYQAPGVELALVIFAPIVHVAAGATRALRRRAKAKAAAQPETAEAQSAGAQTAEAQTADAQTADATTTGRPRGPGPLRLRLHRASGLVLALAFVGHVAATRGPGIVFDMPADFTFLHYSLSEFPLMFYPYYAVFALSGLYHLGHGTLAALTVLGARVPRAWHAPRGARFWAPVSVGSAALLVGLLALGGVFFEVDTARFVEIEALIARLGF